MIKNAVDLEKSSELGSVGKIWSM